MAVYAAVDEAIARARAGEGPTLIEAMTYRHGDHSMRANLPGYREDEEVERWKAMDPIDRCASLLREREAMSREEYDALVAETDAIIEEAIESFGGNIALAAQALELSPSTIYRKRQAWAEMDDKRGAA